MSRAAILSPGEHPHSDRPNFTADVYMQMCRDGEAKYSVSEFARLLGISRQELYRAHVMASVPDDEFEAVLAAVKAKGRLTSTAIADEIRRRTGRSRDSVETCPHCGGALRVRRR